MGMRCGINLSGRERYHLDLSKPADFTSMDSAREQAGLYRDFAVVHSVTHMNPKRTEQFLMDQEHVQDASVWWDGQFLRAHVTVDEVSNWTVQDLQRECLQTLGVHQTPKSIHLLQVRPTVDLIQVKKVA